MSFRLGLVAVVCVRLLCAQTGGDREVTRAQAGLEKLRALVAAGVAPRVQLEQAEAALADAGDAAILRQTLYGQDLTDEQTETMLQAAERRLERRQKGYARAQEMVKAGVATPLSLGTFLEELDHSRKELDLAESRARLSRNLAAMARAEEDLERRLAQAPSDAPAIAERFDGGGVFTVADFRRIETAFMGRFAKALPVSAMGETALHRALGFDHRNRVDVAVHPDQPEGLWLRSYLVQQHIPFFAFRHAVPGKATGAHIHIGPMSTRLANGG
jgi:hypothetical protein